MSSPKYYTYTYLYRIRVQYESSLNIPAMTFVCDRQGDQFSEGGITVTSIKATRSQNN